MSKVLYEVSERIAYITLNRPDAKNAIDQDVHKQLVEAFTTFSSDSKADVAIVTGKGDAFCAGMDLKKFVPEIVGASPKYVREMADLGLGGLTRGLHRLKKPVIGAVNGWALAAGFELALACDIRVASERASFGSFEARRGFHHGDGGIPRLVNMCGTAVAMELVLTADPVDAKRALHLNLVSSVVPHEQLMEEAKRWALKLLRNDQAALHSAKETVLEMVGRNLDDQLRLEAMYGYSCMASGVDVRKRLQRFYEKTDTGRVGAHAAEKTA
ncbi:enoyl-CoA hydratase/isomerase family protein [Rhodoferax sp. UBA5149]|uniref:enoyl-CoA hydratase/isomerase family protein n=1 Tax=Rhodoferax sp. UBA5149 TaxID=1947379 RepID=UPI0025F2E644|nr:enoyl-CoA hydratase/isomerase family protein [Rhodoferax sp. UBA5149]